MIEEQKEQEQGALTDLITLSSNILYPVFIYNHRFEPKLLLVTTRDAKFYKY